MEDNRKFNQTHGVLVRIGLSCLKLILQAQPQWRSEVKGNCRIWMSESATAVSGLSHLHCRQLTLLVSPWQSGVTLVATTPKPCNELTASTLQTATLQDRCLILHELTASSAKYSSLQVISKAALISASTKSSSLVIFWRHPIEVLRQFHCTHPVFNSCSSILYWHSLHKRSVNSSQPLEILETSPLY